MKDFYLIIPLGLEELALRELREKLPTQGLVLELTPGGLKLSAPEQWIPLLHQHLKIPTRVLMRLDQFKARDLPRLYKKLAAHPWRLYLQSPPDHVAASTHHSRLTHTGKIEQAVRDAILDSLRAEAPKKRAHNQQPETVYLRLEQDQVTLSLDLTGHPLFERTGAPLSSGHRASIRTNLAAAQFYALIQGLPRETSYELVDPMMGSGTLLKEAYHFYVPNDRPHAFHNWLKNHSFPEINQTAPKLHLLGGDLHQAAHGLPLDSFVLGDCFKANYPTPTHPRLVISNPPYGERLKKTFRVPELLTLYRDQLKASRAGLVTPRSWDFTPLLRPGERFHYWDFKNGGLAVRLWVLDFGTAWSFEPSLPSKASDQSGQS